MQTRRICSKNGTGMWSNFKEWLRDEDAIVGIASTASGLAVLAMSLADWLPGA